MTIDSNGTSFFQKFGWTVMSWIQNLPSVFSYTAPTRHFGRRTRVRRGVLRATPLPARRCRVPFFFFRRDKRRFGPNRSVSAATTDTGAEPADSGRNSKNKRCETHRLAEIKNKKKIAKRTVWTKTLYLSLQFSSSALSPSLVFALHATALWPLLSVSPLSHSHNLTLKSLNSQLTHTLLSVSPQVSISSFLS